MNVLVVLWLFTSSYAIPLGTYPSGQGCVVGAVMTEAQIKGQKGPKPFLYRLACVPTVMPGAARPRDRPASSV